MRLKERLHGFGREVQSRDANNGAHLGHKLLTKTSRIGSGAVSKKKIMIVASLLFTSFAFLGCSDASQRAADKRPHIVFILIDTLRARNLSCYGYHRVTSPTIDALAANGALFEHAISIGGNTCTAMPAMITDKLPFFEFGSEWGEVPFGMDRFRNNADGLGLPKSMKTLAEVLQGSGYHTCGFITNAYLKSVLSMNRGYDHYTELFYETGVPNGRGDELTDLAVEYLSGVDFGEPVFLYLHFMDVHGPYMRPGEGSLFSKSSLQRQAEHMTKWREWEPMKGDISGRRAELRDYMIDACDTSIRFVDGCVAKIVGYLEARGVLSHSVIIVTADHGEEFLEHGRTTHKGALFEEIVHVPLILTYPSVPSGVRISQLVRNFDVMPTVLEIAGIDRPAALEAKSLIDVLMSPEDDPDRTAYAGFPWLRMVRDSRHKLLVRKNGAELLFDLSADPGEKENLLGPDAIGVEAVQVAGQTSRQAMGGFVEMLRAQGGGGKSGATESLDEETRQQLRALGYLK